MLKAQVKIGDTPNAINENSILELESSNKGLLPPRVILNNINSVAPLTASTPVGMLVYSSGGTVTDGYYFWNGSKWTAFNITLGRSNYVLVKSVSDFPAPVGGVITLVAGTEYEINGSVNIAEKIDLNNCALKGNDVFTDKLIYTGSAELFTGSNVGDISVLTLTASTGKVFNINAGGSNRNFLIQNCNFMGSQSIGTIQGVGGILYISNVGYFNNSDGHTFQNDNHVHIHNSFWDDSNSNIYEKFVGVFNTIEILGGSRNVGIGKTATSIAGVSSLTNGSIKTVSYSGSGTYVNGVFSNNWEVESSGLNTEKDDVAGGDMYLSGSAITTFAVVDVPVKMVGVTIPVNLFRMTAVGNNRLTYIGKKNRKFMAIISLTGTPAAINNIYSFYIAKNGVILPESEQSVKFNSASDQQSVTVSSSVFLSTDDYIEVWVKNSTNTGKITILHFNASIH